MLRTPLSNKLGEKQTLFEAAVRQRYENATSYAKDFRVLPEFEIWQLVTNQAKAWFTADFYRYISGTSHEDKARLEASTRHVKVAQRFLVLAFPCASYTRNFPVTQCQNSIVNQA